MRRIIVLILALLLLSASAHAQPTSTPMPTGMPGFGFGSGGGLISDPAVVSVVTTFREEKLKNYFSHGTSSNGGSYDGAYAPWFGGMELALKENQMPSITDEVLEVKVVFKGNHPETSASSVLYRERKDGLEEVPLEGDVIPWSELSTGRYLLRVNYSAGGENYGYSGFALAWVTVLKP